MLIIIGFISTGTAVTCHARCGFFTFICILNSTSTERFAVCLKGNEDCLAKCNKKAKERDANKDNTDNKDDEDMKEFNDMLMPPGGRG